MKKVSFILTLLSLSVLQTTAQNAVVGNLSSIKGQII
jgi:hypothetical protein